jgi:hypothetical protein
LLRISHDALLMSAFDLDQIIWNGPPERRARLPLSVSDSRNMPLTSGALLQACAGLRCYIVCAGENRQALRSSRVGGVLAPDAKQKRPAMPRYFFNLCDGNGKDLVRDSEGAPFATVREARKEAIGLGQDIVRHGFHRPTWQMVVIDENGDRAFTVPLVEIRAGKMRALLDLLHRIVIYEPRFRSQLFTWLLLAAVLAMIAQATVATRRVKGPSDDYQLASVSTGKAFINVRFAQRTSVAELNSFLAAYKASLMSCSLPGGWYCLRISGPTMGRESLEKIANKMKQETIVSSAVVGYIEDEQ